jgi:hypothetical protein
MEFVCLSKFCASVFASLLRRHFSDGALCERAVEAGPEFLGVVFQVLQCCRTSLLFRRVCAERPVGQISAKTTDNEVNSIAERVNRFMGEVSLREI